MIETRQLSWRIHGAGIVSEVTTEFARGKVKAILGPNGSGKSTLLRMMSGYLKPSEGSVLMNGKPLHDWSTANMGKWRAILFQETHLDFDFSVEEVIAMGRSVYGEGKLDPQGIEYTRQAMRMLDLEYLQGKPYPPLSGGEKQRVQIARVINQILGDSMEEKILLLDEPLNNLDPMHAHEVMKMLNQLAQQGVTVGVVVHDLNMALRYADRALLMDCGYLVAEGNPANVLACEAAKTAFQMTIRIHEFETYQGKIRSVVFE